MSQGMDWSIPGVGEARSGAVSWMGSDKLSVLDARLAEFSGLCPDFSSRLHSELCKAFNVTDNDVMFWSDESVMQLGGTSGFGSAVSAALRSAGCYDLDEWYDALSWDNGDIFDSMLIDKFLR